MIALRLVIDTNVLVSAALKPESLQRTVLLIAITKPARFYVSQEILDEYAGVLARRELRIRKGARLQILELVKNRSHLVVPRRKLHAASDLDDNIFIECADAARADFLITGNRRHFPAFWKGTKMVSPREFVEAAAPHLLGE
jgi:putative PIN family toxin of toxin-antitoxin system